MNHILVLCAECKNVVLAAQTSFSNAKGWDGMLICTPCGKKKKAQWIAGVSEVKFESTGRRMKRVKA